MFITCERAWSLSLVSGLGVTLTALSLLGCGSGPEPGSDQASGGDAAVADPAHSGGEATAEGGGATDADEGPGPGRNEAGGEGGGDASDHSGSDADGGGRGGANASGGGGAGGTQPAVVTPTADAFSGSWSGHVTWEDGSGDWTFNFSQAGNLIFEYAVKGGGKRTAELSASGQVVPAAIVPSGDVMRMTVDSVVHQGNQLSITWHQSFEGSSDCCVTQEYGSSRVAFILEGEAMQYASTDSFTRYLNGSQVAAGETHYSGLLHRN
jgi:hypothetical protein